MVVLRLMPGLLFNFRKVVIGKRYSFKFHEVMGMKRKRQTKIICTLGPASESKEVIMMMAKEGMDVARLNFSHGDHSYHQRMIDVIRAVNKTTGVKIKILQDLEGYRIRIGDLKEPITLGKEQVLVLAHHLKATDKEIPLDLDTDYSRFKKGMLVYIDDGLLCLEVLGSKAGRITVKVRQGGILKSRKGVNIPELILEADILTEKDQFDLAFGLNNRMDYIAQSFVRNRRDILRVRQLVKKEIPEALVFAKIENQEGVSNLDSIAEACDGILIARGDLGVSLPIYKIPVIQKSIIRRCNKKKKYSMTATQMLESMTENKRPTRAEVSDVANAILDGTDYVMLSGETAAGRFPVESVQMMNQIVEYTEQSMSLKD
jgi:pyruvate kinase